jgi:hypothetical protein
MNFRSFLYLAVTAVLLSASLIFIGLMPYWQGSIQRPVLSPNDIRGMAVESNGLLYTLNFEQQNHVVNALNTGKNPTIEGCAPSFERLIIYRFDAPDKHYHMDP